MWLWLLLTAGTLAIGAYWALFQLGPWRQHVPFLWVLLVASIWCWLNPLVNTIKGTAYYIHDIPVAAYLAPVMRTYCLGIAVLVGGYILFQLWLGKKEQTTNPLLIAPSHFTWWIDAGFWLCGFGIWLWLKLYYISVFDLLNIGNDAEYLILYKSTLSHHPAENLGDCFIAWLVLGYAYRIPWYRYLPMFVVALLYFLVSGWRYRFLLTGLGLAVVWLMQQKETPQLKWRLLLLAGIGASVLAVVTLNRFAIARRHAEHLNLDFSRFSGDSLFLEETNNALTSAAVYRYRDSLEAAGLPAQHDYGVSMLGYSVLRFVPSSFFPDKEKPIPPVITTLRRANRIYLMYPGAPALNFIDEYEFAFGWPGVAVFCGLLAFGLYQLSLLPSNAMNSSLMGLVMGWLFQHLTRGYLPQHIELAVFLFAPWIIVAWLQRKIQPSNGQ